MMEFEKAKSYILERLQKELNQNLSYHSIFHTMDVYNSAENLGRLEGIKDYEMTLLLTACLYHDSGFVEQQKDHELISCSIARENLPRFNYTNEEIETICGIIMATKIPQTPHNLLEQIICDADLDYLGRDDVFTISNKLLLEMRAHGSTIDEKQWDKIQVPFLESHHYFTDAAIRLRQAKKDEYISFLKSKTDN